MKKKGKGNHKKHLDAYEVITTRFIEYIEKNGSLPWRKPWMVVHPEIAPRNFITQNPYRGVNVLLTLMSGYASPYWMSFKQAASLGGYARKDEHGTKIIKYEPPNQQKIKAIDEDDSLTDEEKDEAKSKLFGYYKVSTVFNAEQIEGIEFPEIPKPEPATVFNPIKEAEQVVDAMPNRPHIVHGPARAFYSPMSDTVNMPPTELFITSPEHYYSTLFHELAHSTGHKCRLGRLWEKRISTFGSIDYSKEELIAELASSFIMNEIGIENADTERNSAAYLANWCKAMKKDQRMLLKAMNKAIPAANYIFGRIAEKEVKKTA